jgi:hypothetical protein
MEAGGSSGTLDTSSPGQDLANHMTHVQLREREGLGHADLGGYNSCKV